jgi:uncharacterized protein (DUF1330 family)
MAAYLIFTREGPITDQAEMDQYQAKNRANGVAMAQAHPMRPLAFYGPYETLEGDAPDGVVMLEFPDADAARAWYESPEYQAALVHRKRAAHYRVILVEGI